jgi:hypothetical protein
MELNRKIHASTALTLEKHLPAHIIWTLMAVGMLWIKKFIAPVENRTPNPRLSSLSASYCATDLSQLRYYPPKMKNQNVLEIRESSEYGTPFTVFLRLSVYD